MDAEAAVQSLLALGAASEAVADAVAAVGRRHHNQLSRAVFVDAVLSVPPGALSAGVSTASPVRTPREKLTPRSVASKVQAPAREKLSPSRTAAPELTPERREASGRLSAAALKTMHEGQFLDTATEELMDLHALAATPSVSTLPRAPGISAIAANVKSNSRRAPPCATVDSSERLRDYQPNLNLEKAIRDVRIDCDRALGISSEEVTTGCAREHTLDAHARDVGLERFDVVASNWPRSAKRSTASPRLSEAEASRLESANPMNRGQGLSPRGIRSCEHVGGSAASPLLPAPTGVQQSLSDGLMETTGYRAAPSHHGQGARSSTDAASSAWRAAEIRAAARMEEARRSLQGLDADSCQKAMTPRPERPRSHAPQATPTRPAADGESAQATPRRAAPREAAQTTPRRDAPRSSGYPSPRQATSPRTPAASTRMSPRGAPGSGASVASGGSFGSAGSGSYSNRRQRSPARAAVLPAPGAPFRFDNGDLHRSLPKKLGNGDRK